MYLTVVLVISVTSIGYFRTESQLVLQCGAKSLTEGVWYRGWICMTGSVASLEEMFNPDRLKETHIPGRFKPLGTDARAIPGHTFGLNLKPEERQQLIAFLKTL
jgi:hypothetical protein